MKKSFNFFTTAYLSFYFIFVSVFLSYLVPLMTKLENFNKDRNVYSRFFESPKKEKEGTLSLSTITLPEKLCNLPFGRTNPLILKTKNIPIRNVKTPYNASLVKHGNGYLLFFRYDTLQNKKECFSFIGCVELDSNFNQTEKEFTKIDTGNNHSEDPRIFSIGRESFLLYATSELYKIKKPKESFFISTITIAKIDLEKRKLTFTNDLELNFTLNEKNWVPFEYRDAQGNLHFYLQYSLNPHKILHLPNPHINHLAHPIFPKEDVFQKIHWENKQCGWGTLRGGTPALKIGEEYLAFFHSCFRDHEGVSWYNMGAYTFEAEPPFRITAISPYPLLFDGIYASSCLNTAHPQRRVIFPTGFVIEQKEEGDLIHLSCGENDSTIKLITLDKEMLLKSLNKI